MIAEVDIRSILGNEQPLGESGSRELAPEMQPAIETLAVDPANLAVQPVSVVDAIQNILKNQDIDTSSLRRKKCKGNKKVHRRAYDNEMNKIKQVVSQTLRDQFENVGDPA